jgi:hypothetical protein
MIRYILIAVVVLASLTGFIALMCLVARRLIWPNESLHPSFVGSLIGASGTIFAATIAWMISDNNIAFQKTVATEQARQQLVVQRGQQQRALEAMEEVGRYLDGLLANFDGVPADRLARYFVYNFALKEIPLAGVPAPSPLINDIIAARADLSRFQTMDLPMAATLAPTSQDTIAAVNSRLEGVRVLRQRVTADIEARRKELN